MGRLLLFGIVVLPPIAATIACAVASMLNLVLPVPFSAEKLHLKPLWFGALVLAFPCALIGTAIAALWTSDRRRDGASYVKVCSAVGLVLGVLGFAMMWASLDSVRVGMAPRDQIDPATVMLAICAAVTGFLSGGSFGVATLEDANDIPHGKLRAQRDSDEQKRF